jgi:uncharacterized protein YbaA (DUF1428 family)
VSGCADTARSLYLELRALRLEVWAEDDPDGDTVDFRIAVGGLHRLSEADAMSVWRRVLENEEGLVQLVLDGRDPDLNAIRREGYCR